MPKRLFDLVFSALALVLLTPVLIVVAAWVRWDSPGTVFFRQTRVGRNGRLFRIYKFRTMQSQADKSGPAITIGADARITRAGRWLRRTKMDELPQFINVLHGDMSVVGPRPEVPIYVAAYPDSVRDQVLSVRPGITDLASIAFRNESDVLACSPDPERAYLEQILPTKLRWAQHYVHTRNLWLDLQIIIWTALAVLGLRVVLSPPPTDNP